MQPQVPIDVALAPREARRGEGQICLVVDVLRASSMLVTLFEHGAQVVLPAASVPAARRLARDHAYLVGGERGALRVAGFDFGNSPTGLHGIDLAGRGAVLTTSNGTAVLRRLERARAILIACVLNASAACTAALRLAAACSTGVQVVCAGKGGAFVLDDAVCAGFLVKTLLAKAAGEQADLHLSDAAYAAQRLAHSFEDLLQPFRISASGRRIAETGQEADLPFCARPDVSGRVPVLLRSDPLRIESRRPEDPVERFLFTT
ncbi:MAG: 2-phosphosulfolactate phosphatase [Anaerolineaceae bacterium]|nr:2-phosphosulfolactate phosphatase [Anaerolineaceae bacterium]